MGEHVGSLFGWQAASAFDDVGVQQPIDLSIAETALEPRPDLIVRQERCVAVAREVGIPERAVRAVAAVDEANLTATSRSLSGCGFGST